MLSLVPMALSLLASTPPSVVDSRDDLQPLAHLIQHDGQVARYVRRHADVWRLSGSDAVPVGQDPLQRFSVALCDDATEVVALGTVDGGTLLSRASSGALRALQLDARPASPLVVNRTADSDCRIGLLLDDGSVVRVDVGGSAARRVSVFEQHNVDPTEAAPRSGWARVSDAWWVQQGNQLARLRDDDVVERTSLSNAFQLYAVDADVYVLDVDGRLFHAVDGAWQQLDAGGPPVAAAIRGRPTWVDCFGTLWRLSDEGQLTARPFASPTPHTVSFVDELQVDVDEWQTVFGGATSVWMKSGHTFERFATVHRIQGAPTRSVDDAGHATWSVPVSVDVFRLTSTTALADIQTSPQVARLPAADRPLASAPQAPSLSTPTSPPTAVSGCSSSTPGPAGLWLLLVFAFGRCRRRR